MEGWLGWVDFGFGKIFRIFLGVDFVKKIFILKFPYILALYRAKVGIGVPRAVYPGLVVRTRRERNVAR